MIIGDTNSGPPPAAFYGIGEANQIQYQVDNSVDEKTNVAERKKRYIAAAYAIVTNGYIKYLTQNIYLLPVKSVLL